MFNDLAKAIAFFEVAIEDGENLQKNCGLELQAELAKQKQHFHVAISAMQLILSDPKMALRLQKAKALSEGSEGAALEFLSSQVSHNIMNVKIAL